MVEKIKSGEGSMIKFISGLVIIYPIFNLIVWKTALIAVYISSKFIPPASDFYGVIAFFIIPFIICIYLARGLVKYDKLARTLVILFCLIIILNNIPVLIEALTISLKFNFPTLLTLIPAVLRVIAAVFVGLYLLFNKKIKGFK